MSNDSAQWDYIVVGAGSSGCVVASRLSENPRNRVLLLEAGGSDGSPIFHVPLLAPLLAVGSKKTDWCYQTEADPSRCGRADSWPRGKVLGGSSSINGMVHATGNRGDYDSWAQLGNEGWSYDDVLPYFRKAESNVLGPSSHHGADGPLSVETLRGPHRLSRVFLTACAEAGIPPNRDYNGARQEGAAIAQVTQRRGRRHSAAQAYLRPAIRRQNLKVVTGAHVLRILFDGKRAVGIEYRHNAAVRRANLGGELILSAGAINSPQILMLSGVGPAAHLREMGIEVVNDLPGVGENLQEHMGVSVQATVNVSTLNVEMTPLRAAAHGLKWLLFREGALCAGFEAVAFARVMNGSEYPDVQFHFGALGTKLTDAGFVLYDEPTITIHANATRPRSRGRILLASRDPHRAPLIQVNMMSDPADMWIVREGGRLARRILETRAFAPFIISESAPGRDIQTDDEWERFIRETAAPEYHPVGTCGMGREKGAVADQCLRVHGADGLRVVDASIMPTLPSANTNAACIMIGEKAADMLMSD